MQPKKSNIKLEEKKGENGAKKNDNAFNSIVGQINESQ